MSSTSWSSNHKVDDPFRFSFETVGELTARIKQCLEGDFGQVAVRGEISNVARPRSGHIYFTIKDESASIRAVMWKNDSRRLVFDMTDGLAVRALRTADGVCASGRIPDRGERSRARRHGRTRASVSPALCATRARRVVRYEARSAAYRDIHGESRSSRVQPGLRCATYCKYFPAAGDAPAVLIVPTRVQGIGADLEVVAAIALANRIAQTDVIILARGGGSSEDLWTFNEENVVRAIAASRLPVVSAVGHEIDVTLADLAADSRALTPSEAAELCVHRLA